MSGTSELRPNPFVGPRPIQQGEALHGRKREIRELYEHLTGHRIVVLHSPSGAGKSSLVQAGLIPRLREAKFDVWRPIRVNLDPSTFEGVPADVNRHVLSALVSLEDELPAPHRRSPADLAKLGFLDYLDGRPRRKGRSDQSAVLIFDQFEEILSIAPRAIEAKRAFFSAVGAALDTGRYWALFVIREDYLAALAPYRDLLPTQLTNTYRLDLLGQGGAREAASKLAEEGGRSFPAVDKLVRDLSVVHVQQPDGSFVAEQGIHVEPVYLQVVCRRLWAAMPDDADSIDEADVEAYAQVSKSLAGYYADAVAAIAGDDAALERGLRDWVGTRLIVGGIRSQVRQQVGGDGDISLVHIHRLLDSYLIRSEQRAGANWYELSHDRLVEPVLQDNEAWQQAHLHALQVQAKLWDSGGRAQALLLGPDALPGAHAWATAHPRLLTAGEREFLALSQDRRDREVRQRRGRQVFTVMLAAVAVVAVVFGVLADQAREAAEAAQRTTEVASKAAEAALEKAEAAQDAAQEAKEEAVSAAAKAQRSQAETKLVVLQMFNLALRPLTERLIAEEQSVGVLEVNGDWTSLLSRDEQSLVAATIGKEFRLVVAGHDAVLNGFDADRRSLFLEITAQWMLAHQDKRKVALISREAAHPRQIEDLERNLEALADGVERHTSLVSEALTDVGMVILDDRWTPPISADEVAVLKAFVKRGGGVLAVGRGRSWLDSSTVAAPALDDYPMNTALAAFGAAWSGADVSPTDLKEVAATVRFENTLDVEVTLYVQSAGREEYYATLKAGETRAFPTVVGGKWGFVAAADKTRLGTAVIESEEQTVTITPVVTSESTPRPARSDGTDQQMHDTLTAEDMQPALKKAKRIAKACGQELGTYMDSIVIRVTVGADGKVKSVDVLPPAELSREGSCIKERVKKLSFARSRSGGEVTWPLKFDP